MNSSQKERALGIMKKNLAMHNDWIVLCQTAETLGRWAKKDDGLRSWLLPHLRRLGKDERNSVSKKAQKVLAMLVI